MSIAVRASTRDDAETIANFNRKWVEYLRTLGDPNPQGLEAEQYVREGFGESPAFDGLIAETEGKAVGYLLYHHAFDLDRGGRYLHIFDLFVDDESRGQGVGKALVGAATEICRSAGGHQLFWSVYIPNESAKAFYERLGAAYTKDLLFMYLPV